MTTPLPSKERLAEIHKLAAKSDKYIYHLRADEVEAMARALLAAYEQEPVEEVVQKLNGYERPMFVVAIEGEVEEGDVLYAHPAPSIHIDENSDLIKHIRKCSEEVSKWPEWKRNAADAMSAIDAPSIPAVPDSIQMRKALVWLDEVIQSNPGMKEPVTCRAAMLNGGKS